MGGYTGFRTEEPLHQLIRHWYVESTGGLIFFQFPRKYFVLPSAEFLLASGAFYSLITTAVIFGKNSKRWLFPLLSIGIFFLALYTLSSFWAKAHYLECTACGNRPMRMFYDDVHYNNLLLWSYVLAIVPLVPALWKALKISFSRAKNE